MMLYASMEAGIGLVKLSVVELLGSCAWVRAAQVATGSDTPAGGRDILTHSAHDSRRTTN